MPHNIPAKTIKTLKQDAKRIKKVEKITQAEALNKIAQKEGFRSWGVLLNAIRENKINSFEQLYEIITKPSLTIIGGRPAMGKTSLAIQLGLRASKKRSVLFFSYEMLSGEITKRILSMESDIETKKTYKKSIQNSKIQKTADFRRSLTNVPLFVNDNPISFVADIKLQITKRMEENPLVIIDYLQLIPPNEKIKGRINQLMSILSEIRKISRDLMVPIIVLSQLNRNLENRDNKRPIKSDLRDFGKAIKLVDQVVFIYRPGYYESKNDNSRQNEAEIIISEHRNLKKSVIKVSYDPKIGKFIID